jgi:hypothetical protein
MEFVVIKNKELAREILLESARKMNELEFDQMAEFYAGGKNTTASHSTFVFPHVWAAISRDSLVPLGSLDAELKRGIPDTERAVLQKMRDKLAELDA